MTPRRKIVVFVLVAWAAGATAVTLTVLHLANIGHQGQYHP